MWQICTPRVFPVLFHDENTKLLFVVKLAIEASLFFPSESSGFGFCSGKEIFM